MGKREKLESMQYFWGKRVGKNYQDFSESRKYVSTENREIIILFIFNHEIHNNCLCYTSFVVLR